MTKKRKMEIMDSFLYWGQFPFCYKCLKKEYKFGGRSVYTILTENTNAMMVNDLYKILKPTILQEINRCIFYLSPYLELDPMLIKYSANISLRVRELDLLKKIKKEIEEDE